MDWGRKEVMRQMILRSVLLGESVGITSMEPKTWYDRLKRFLHRLGFKRLKWDTEFRVRPVRPEDYLISPKKKRRVTDRVEL